MPTVWVMTHTHLQLSDMFRSAKWAVETYQSQSDMADRLSQVREPDLIVFDLEDKPPSEHFRRMCYLKMSALLAVVANWELAFQAIEAGADDAALVSADSAELLFRARKLLREASVVCVHDLAIDLTAHRVKYHGQLVRLTPVEFRLLACLAKRVGEAVGYDQILDEVWGSDLEAGGTLDQIKDAVKRLRKKIEPEPGRPQFIITIKGFGYRLRSQMQWENSMIPHA